jgi:hypothetical protein
VERQSTEKALMSFMAMEDSFTAMEDGEVPR